MKKNILIVMGRYLPGYKDGGPVRSIKNLVDYLGDEYNFKILTCDRDHGDEERYANIKVNEWNIVGKAKVYYVSPKGFKLSTIKKLSKESDLIYCCGCFSDYSIKTLLLKRLKQIDIPVVLAAMGLFSPMEFRLKYFKKKAFTTCFNILGMFRDVHWSATSDMEAEDIKKQIKVSGEIFIAQDLPRKVVEKNIQKEKEKGTLKVVWISRIAPKKNLKGAIRILQNVKSNIEFTIYGPDHNKEYWNECKKELKNLPNNVNWIWKGNIESEKVVDELKEHHVFLFPTLGENYGHVIQEAFSAGCPVILSDQTPWNDLENKQVGHNFSVYNEEGFIKAIELYASMNRHEFQYISNKALEYAMCVSKDKVKETGYRNIFNLLI